MKFLSSISNAFYDASILTWDLLLTLGNLVRFSRPVGSVTPEGHPGYGGTWPEYRPSQEGDSRSCCPALNAMANHGIISRSGRGIKFTELPEHIHATFNFSTSYCHYACHYAARMLNKSYSRDTFDLEEISLHNGIEHDASLTRLDTALQPNQAVIHPPFIEELFSFATGKDAAGNPLLTLKDLSRILGKRRVESKATNKEYSLRFADRIFSSANASTISTIFGGRIDDLRTILLEERLPEGWESRVRKPYGLTMLTFNWTILPMEFSIREADWTVGAASQAVEEDA
ncbi:Chloroperoxidase [Butyriboletus roseoflavus]|nr:Chloroperoxidase [Butyriboletus roseoflavus]